MVQVAHNLNCRGARNRLGVVDCRISNLADQVQFLNDPIAHSGAEFGIVNPSRQVIRVWFRNPHDFVEVPEQQLNGTPSMETRGAGISGQIVLSPGTGLPNVRPNGFQKPEIPHGLILQGTV